jgi:hypothetical protein
MTRYLLGELSEPERTTLEESYFSDSRFFDQLQKAENDLLDDYARGRLSSSLRQRLEQRYLAHPERRARLRFAEALVTRLDAIEQSDSAAAAPQSWATFLDRFRARAPALAVFAALTALLVLVAGIWFFVNTTTRLRQELSEAQAARTVHEQRERELQQQVADQQARADQLASDLDRLRTELQTAGPGTKSSAPLVASLILAVGGIRGPETGPPATLVIPTGATQARLQLKLEDNDYPAYSVVLQAAGGKQVFKRERLLPQSKPRPSLLLMVPADKLPDGDYILALKGVTQSGETEDVSKLLFRVERK